MRFGAHEYTSICVVTCGLPNAKEDINETSGGKKALTDSQSCVLKKQKTKLRDDV